MATALPTAASFTGSTVTEAQFKTAITDLRTFLADQLGTDGEIDTALATLRTLCGGITFVTTATTLTDANRGDIVHTTGTTTVTLPLISATASGWSCVIRNAGSNTVTVARQGSDLIDGAASITIAPGDASVIYNNSANWNTLIDKAAISDDSITVYKLSDLVQATEVNKSTVQTVTTSYADYLTLSAQQTAYQNALIIGSVTFNCPATSQTIGARITFGGSAYDTITLTTSGADEVITIPVFANVAATTLATRTAAIQVYKSSASVTTAVAGSLSIIRVPVQV
jgi:hypothetical protein